MCCEVGSQLNLDEVRLDERRMASGAWASSQASALDEELERRRDATGGDWRRPRL
jgi:hypothetical protein